MHSSIRFSSSLLASVTAGAPLLTATTFEIQQLDSFTGPASSSEIVAFSRQDGLLYNTYGSAGNGGVQIIDSSNPSALASTGLIDMSVLGGSFVGAVSSVAADPLGRGFGIATFIPQKSGSEMGRVVFFDPVARTVLHSVEVGYHPDMVRFSADGTKLFIANEGESVSEPGAPTTHFDRPGSVSVVDLAGLPPHSDVMSLGAGQVGTYDFSAGNLQGGVNLDSVRVHPSNTAPASRLNDIEPEYMTELNGKLYISLQENNAIAEFDLGSRQYTDIRPLGTILQRVDASDRDGAGGDPGILIDDIIHGMPMPDGIASLSTGGGNFLFTANEGDA